MNLSDLSMAWTKLEIKTPKDKNQVSIVYNGKDGNSKKEGDNNKMSLAESMSLTLRKEFPKNDE